MQGRLDVVWLKLREVIFRADFFGGDAGLKQVQNLPKHDACPPDAGLSVTNFRINANRILHELNGSIGLQVEQDGFSFASKPRNSS